MTTGGYYLSDALGSVMALADEGGTKVNPYSYSLRGVTRAATSESILQPHRFAGGYQDPTGLYPLRGPLLRPQHRLMGSAQLGSA
ncbi:hypothetical protein [Streptomyces chryseus]